MKNVLIFCLVAALSQAAFAQQTTATTTPAPAKKACCAAGGAMAGKSCAAAGSAKTGASCADHGTAEAGVNTDAKAGMTKKTAVASDLQQTAQFAVLGNCGMCKKTIEKAALGAGASTAVWDVKADMLAVTFEASKTSTDAIQKAVALAGYDNAGYKADEVAYNNLHACCQYDRTGAAGGTKSCAADVKQ